MQINTIVCYAVISVNGQVLETSSTANAYRHIDFALGHLLESNPPYRNPERAALKPLINTNYLCADTATKITVMLKDRHF